MSNTGDATVINDRYEIHKRVGRGGMADVFLARDLLLDRQVAMKVLFPEFAVDPNFVERFRREAQAAANLSHPNIVNVYDWGKFQGTYFIAMEYVQGRTLADILKTNKRLTPKQAAEIASEVAAALGFAHEAELAHRDIKPANILIGGNGQVKVADFGIARAMNSGTESNLTQVGSVMGTASYFSPEQAQGAQPDPRSDLYSLGVVMYEMVAGRPPFAGENAVSIAYKQVHDQPKPLNQIVDGVPRPFEAIVAKLLAKDPKVRYPSAHALRDDLRRFRNGEQVQALVAAAATRPGGTPSGGIVRPTTTIDDAATTVQRSQPGAAATGPEQYPQIPGAASTSMARQPDPDLTAYPPGASPEAHYYQERSSRTGWYALAAFIALVALVAGGVLLYQGLSERSSGTAALTLDDYTNQPLESVTGALRALGLPYEAIPDENPQIPEEFVHRTDPVAGTVVAEGTVIKIFFNPTEALVPVPNVAGRTIEDARNELGAAGFQIRETSEVNELAEGLVIRTEPAGGELVRQDQTIEVVVSGGPDQVSIPPTVINDELEIARSTLESEAYGLVVEVREIVDDVIPIGVVVRTDPEPNTLVDRGSTIILFVSSGPGQVQVPGLIGLTENQARSALSDNGLQINVQRTELDPGDPADGTVVEQNLAAGQNVDRNSVVTVVIGEAAAPVTTTTSPPTTTTTLAPTTTTTTTTTTTP